MPNWHTNAIAIHKDNKHLFLDNDDNVSFDKLKPMPQALKDVPSGAYEKMAIESLKYKTLDEFNKRPNHIPGRDLKLPFNDQENKWYPFPIKTYEDFQKLGEKYLDNLQKYGTTSWYEWRLIHWGTKWDASESAIYERGDIAVLIFETPWSYPNIDMFTDVLQKTEHPGYYVEDFDEDFQGIFQWGTTDKALSKPAILSYENEGVLDNGSYEYQYQTGFFEPDHIDWEKLSAELGGCNYH